MPPAEAPPVRSHLAPRLSWVAEASIQYIQETEQLSDAVRFHSIDRSLLDRLKAPAKIDQTAVHQQEDAALAAVRMAIATDLQLPLKDVSQSLDQLREEPTGVEDLQPERNLVVLNDGQLERVTEPAEVALNQLEQDPHDFLRQHGYTPLWGDTHSHASFDDGICGEQKLDDLALKKQDFVLRSPHMEQVSKAEAIK